MEDKDSKKVETMIIPAPDKPTTGEDNPTTGGGSGTSGDGEGG